MKKGVFSILAVLMVFAMTAVGCDDGSGKASGPFTVTFNKNGGDTDANPTKVTVASGAKLEAFPSDPEREGWFFTGWNTKKNGKGSDFTSATVVTHSMTVYAKWEQENEDAYTVTFSKNNSDEGSTEASPQKKQVVPGATIGKLPSPPTRPGYIFRDWNRTSNGSGVLITADTVVNSNMTVFAQWSPVYTVTFDKNDGSSGNAAIIDTKTVTAPATTVAALPADPTRSGYYFTGWNTSEDGSGSAFNTVTPVTDNITVYAQWLQKTAGSFAVTFNKNNTTSGSADAYPMVKLVTPPATTIDALPTAPRRPGYDFAEWNTKTNGTGDVFTAATAVTADITVYAKWSAATYTVTFNKNDGSTGAQATHATRTVTTPSTTVDELPGEPVPQAGWGAGLSFAGWNTRADGTGSAFTATTRVTESITVYAKWNFTRGTPEVVGQTLVHNAPGTPSSGTGNHGTWNGEQNQDGSATFSGGAVSYMFPDGYTDYDFVKIEYVTKGTAMGVILKKGTTTVDWPSKSINQYPTLSAPSSGSFDFNVVDALPTSPGISMQRNNGGPITIKFTKVTFTKGIRHTLTFDTGAGKPIAPMTVTETVPFNLPAATGRLGYNFTGWKSGNTTITNSTNITTDLTLTAQWELKSVFPATFAVDFRDASLTNCGYAETQHLSSVAASDDGASYTLTWGNDHGYESTWAKFAITLPTGIYLCDFEKVTFTLEGLAGDTANKDVSLLGGPALAAATSAAPVETSKIAEVGRFNGGSEPEDMEFLILEDKTATYVVNVDISIYFHAAANTKIRVSNVKFIARIYD